MNRKTLALVMFLGLCFTPMYALADAAKVKEQIFATVEPFYSWVLANRFVFLPSTKERLELADFLMPDLVQLMKEAKEMENLCSKTSPKGDKPMRFEGALLVDLYEGATEVAYEELKTDRLSEGVATLSISLAHINDHVPKGYRDRAYIWREELELRQTKGKWFINNISFRHGRSLRSALQNFIRDGRRDCVATKR
jgi:hypothetical protein